MSPYYAAADGDSVNMMFMTYIDFYTSLAFLICSAYQSQATLKKGIFEYWNWSQHLSFLYTDTERKKN